VFENGVLRKTFQPKKDEVAGKWSRLHNYVSPSVTHITQGYTHYTGLHTLHRVTHITQGFPSNTTFFT
jgi:hypothetical protein